MNYKKAAKKIIESIATKEIKEKGKEELDIAKEELLVPIEGQVVKLEEVPDQIFAQQIMGDGIAIEPSGSQVVAPFQGKITHLLETDHAVGLKTESGVEVLIHVGIDTVKMKGKGFASFVEEGDLVEVGAKLLEFDLDLVAEEAESISTPIVITNTDEFAEINSLAEGKVDCDDKLLEVKFHDKE
ncbi:MAG: PTS sugar transporter subunit IIA [Bacillota bacterium]